MGFMGFLGPLALRLLVLLLLLLLVLNQLRVFSKRSAAPGVGDLEFLPVKKVQRQVTALVLLLVFHFAGKVVQSTFLFLLAAEFSDLLLQAPEVGFLLSRLLHRLQLLRLRSGLFFLLAKLPCFLVSQI